jgi:hypothetical protein
MKVKKNTIFMKNRVKQLFAISLILICNDVIAKENVADPGVNTTIQSRIASACANASSQTDLDVNNVRATILGGGDMWWDLNDAQYEVPKGSFKNSLFAGALWIGGVDNGGQLKAAAQTYRQFGGNDFWPGPLDINTASITAEECLAYNKHFKIDRPQVDEFIARYVNVQDPTYTIPDEIIDWPAHGAPGQDPYLAPFYDANGDGFYNPYDGDYPDYNVTGNNANSKLYGDQTLWWVFNDKGGIHTETQAEPIGLEIHAQAFGFVADNEVNDMTFYNYKIINRGTQPLTKTYFGQWVDPDLGFYLDDYVGCDVGLGLGFCYNGDAEDEGASGYGFNPPAIGVDFFQGPRADEFDQLDNDRDGFIDEMDSVINPVTGQWEYTQYEEIIMSKFVYYNNNSTVTGNPSTGTHFYNYLQGIWKDNVPMTYGGDGKGNGPGATTDLCNFMFPGSTDPDMYAQNGEWTEVTAGNIPADRRFLQSAGPFTLSPGAINYITVGVVWARAKAGGPTASVQLLKVYDREAQALFDNNFNILNGPDAPDLTIRELDKELIFSLSNKESSNNYEESYSEKDPYITKPDNLQNSPNYEFQGYLVYQLVDATTSVTDLDDPDKARLVFRCDVKDNVTTIVNQYLDPVLGVYTPVEEVSGVLSAGMKGSVDNGVEYSFKITEDRFALGNTRLVNHKTYHYMALSYAYNMAEENADPYNVDDPDYDGRNQPYIAGRRNIETYSVIPHFTEPEAGGTVLNSAYGEGVKIQRLEGTGNGNNAMELSDETITEILNSSSHRSLNPIYEKGLGPINVSVVDPVAVKEGTYIFSLGNPTYTNVQGVSTITSYGKWTLTNEATGNEVASSTKPIDVGSEKLIGNTGFSIKVQQGVNPAEDPTVIADNGLISSAIEFENINDRWLTGVPDYDDENGYIWGLNWIRAGSFENDDNSLLSDYSVDDDPNGIYETAVERSAAIPINNFFGGGNFTLEYTGGTWTPYHLASAYKDGPGYSKSTTDQVKMADLHSVDIVFTDDKSQWSKCVVVEANENNPNYGGDPLLAEGGQIKMGLRLKPSVDKNGNPLNDGTMGMSWFPGYAIDIETGERLNIIFAEDSHLSEDNGRDLKWNPTSNIVTSEAPMYDPQSSTFYQGSYLLGGKHFIYVIKGSAAVKKDSTYVDGTESPNYDECAWIYNQLKNYVLPTGQPNPGYSANIWQVFRNASWVGMPILSPGRTLLANDATVKLRVSKPYRQYVTRDASAILDKDDDLVIGSTYFLMGANISHNGNQYAPGDTFTAMSTSFSGSSNARVVSPIPNNEFSARYRFSTSDIVAEKGDHKTAVNALDMINVVPNPYYAYSTYETSQLDNRIKITNLPRRATISIYTISGTLVRQIKKNDKLTSVDWNLKNTFGIPVASGLYVIHVDAKGVGERVLKWFGVMRPIDLDTF